MKTKLFAVLLTGLFITATAFGQRTPPPQPGQPGAGPPRDGRPQDDWMKRLDTNQDGKLDAAELKASMDSSFTAWDKNSNGLIDAGELPRQPRSPKPPNGQGNGQGNGMGNRPPGAPMGQPGMPMAPRPEGAPGQPGARPQGPPMGVPEGIMLPPFFFVDRSPDSTATSRADFERIVKGVFAEMDKNGDGSIGRGESLPPPRPGDGPGRPEGPTPPPNARFIGAEMRFGDKLVTGQPFSAETVIEDTKRLYDGTTAKKELRGAIYRDGAGRTRREQPLDMVGGLKVSNYYNRPVTLIFINDYPGKVQYSLETDNKIARKSPIWNDRYPFPPDADGPPNTKMESLGTKTIEGVNVEGTRMTVDIPVGHLGNDKPLQVISEQWFSPELQVLIMRRNIDPIAGEHVFKLVNVKRAEPAGELFRVPAGYKVEQAIVVRPGN